MTNEIKNMIVPVRCLRCGKIYDLCNVTVVHRYADCTLYKSPCCGMVVDDREWKSSPDIEKIDKSRINFRLDDGLYYNPKILERAI